MAWARQHNYRIHTWTADDLIEMHRLINLGVDAIITNVPDVLRNVYASQETSSNHERDGRS